MIKKVFHLLKYMGKFNNKSLFRSEFRFLFLGREGGGRKIKKNVFMVENYLLSKKKIDECLHHFLRRKKSYVGMSKFKNKSLFMSAFCFLFLGKADRKIKKIVFMVENNLLSKKKIDECLHHFSSKKKITIFFQEKNK